MGERISIPARAKNASQRDEVTTGVYAASITESRVKFVKGWLTGGVDPGDGSVECGPGTEFPMRVLSVDGRPKVDLLSEIFYRVKNCSFTQGEWTGEYFDGADTEEVQLLVANPTTVAVPNIEASTDNLSFRGYGYLRGTDNIGYPDTYHAALDATADAFYEDEVLVPSDLGPTYLYEPFAYREAKATERGMWYDTDGNLITLPMFYASPAADTTFYDPAAFRCGFSVENISGTTDGNYPPPYNTVHGYEIFVDIAFVNVWDPLSQTAVRFSGRVAFIDNAENGNPFDPANDLYIGMEFFATSSFSSNFEYALSTNVNRPLFSGYADQPSALNFVLELSGGTTLTMPLYFKSPFTELPGGSDFTLKATEWWPYKRLDGEPQWDGNTGEWLLDGTIFLDFSNPAASMYHPAL